MARITEWFKKLTANGNKGMATLGTTGTTAQIYSVNDQWDSDTVQQAIQRIVSELLKYKPTHTQTGDLGEQYPTQEELNQVLEVPNTWDTGQDLLEKFYYQYFLKGNAYIIPTFITYASGHRVCTGLYNIDPAEVEHVEDSDGVEGYRFTFSTGYVVELPADEVIHLKRQYAKNDFFGGDAYGRPDTKALKETIKLNYKLLSGVAKGMEASYAVNGVVKINSALDIEKQQKYLNEFYSKLSNGDKGFIVLDNKSELKPIDKKVNLVDSETLKFIDEKILRAYGVSPAILSGDFTPEQLSAFQSVAVDPVIIKASQEFTKKLLTFSQRRKGQQINFYQSDLKYIDPKTLEALKLLLEPGAITTNELRKAVGLPPLEELARDDNGKPLIMMSKNWGTKTSVMNQVLIENNNADSKTYIGNRAGEEKDDK